MRERLTGAVILVAAASILVPEIISGPGGDAPSRADETLAETGPPLTTYELSIDPSRRDGARAEVGMARDSAAIAQAVPPPVTENVPLPPGVEPAAVAVDAAGSERGAAAADATVARVTASEGRTPAGNTPTPAPSARERAPTTTRSTPAPAPATAATRPAATPAQAPTPAAAPVTGKWWVQLGSFSSEQNAQALARKLRDAGYTIDVSRIRSDGRDLHRVRAGPVNDRAAATTLRTRLAAAGQQGTLVAP